jgi:ATP adenylyltransferase
LAPHLPAGALLAATRACTRRALTCGALQPLPTEETVIEEAGVPFLVRLLAAPARNHQALQPPAPGFNPFLPYNPELFVAEVSATHVALLNKYPVVEDHLLLVTRVFEPQDGVLTRADLAALALCLAEFDGLAFYNAGRAAGASQQHRHLQYVPLPLTAGERETPMDPVLRTARVDGAVARCRQLPFAHALSPLDSHTADDLWATYYRLRETLSLAPETPYNLLVTRRWMLLVPRLREEALGVAVNALGFVGALLVRSEEQLARVRAAGPLAILRGVALPAS